ncbi:DNA-directed RNA polymeras-like protein iii largest subunit [Lineolata rhizophorae]|uniref:DNA-directed RNA polymerase subunit n=1 Tax=Lineolata rhizophorae TaxID=578093 RepID=A0A6A6P4W6_9PEZI|nr:DNA-directed RNA polymeras-like protein iii largest subunit [Lineolata rhizophorae]
MADPVSAVKEQVVDWVPKRIRELQFGILSNKDIVNQAVIEVSDRNVYEPVAAAAAAAGRAVTRHGPMDGRMGTSSKNVPCDTCGEELKSCNGHFGYVKLALPAFHVGYFRMIIEVLQSICKSCSRVLIDENQRRKHLRSLRRPNLDNLQRHMICKRVVAECKKCRLCPYCGALNGIVKKAHAVKIVHDQFHHFNKSSAKNKVAPAAKVDFDKTFEAVCSGNRDVERNLKHAADDLNPVRVLNLFRKITETDCELIGMNPRDGRPEMFIWQYVPAPPVTIRPSVHQETATTEDDITAKLGDIIQVSSIIRASLAKGQPVQTIMEQWEFLQLQIALYINSDQPGVQQQGIKPMRGFCQRLKGKQGRFRGNLSGKRVDFSGRTVIGPDPNLGIDEVAVPQRVAVNLTYPERVSRYNIEKLRACVRRGNLKHPGAIFVLKKGGRKVVLDILRNLKRLDNVAAELEVGDTVERHLEDGDIVLFNRQPSLHKLSILSHKAKIRPWRTFRLNECVCNPYNADFDGDEMNLHVPQTEEARTEALELMGVKHNLATPKNGTPIIAAIQDFITCAYLVSNKNQFFDRKTFLQVCGFMFDGDTVTDPGTGERMPVELPEPAIYKPQRLWTGKQVFNVLMRPNKRYKVMVNLEAVGKQFKKGKGYPDLNDDDAYVVVRNSEVMCGTMDKATVGDGKKDSIFYVILRDFGPDYAVRAMNSLAKLSARWLTNQGFSIGIGDVYPGVDLVRRKQALVEDAYAKCDNLIDQFRSGKLERNPGCNESETLEIQISGILSKVRQEAGAICFEKLSRWNAPLIMAKCGSKGSDINVSQMVAAVGQQIIGSKRVADGFQDRTLPHFPKSARQPPSKGFVRNSFFSGLNPTEFIFHAMSGREGLVDTAVKTAETGYISRRLMKSLEDLSTQYDYTVRNSSSGIVQFQYGDDKLDPLDMEGKAKPVNFERTFVHAVTTTWDNRERGLLPYEILDLTMQILQPERDKHVRTSLGGARLGYNDRGDYGVDNMESARVFLFEIEQHILKEVERLKSARRHLEMLAGDQPCDEMDWEACDDASERGLADGISKISERALREFIRLCLTKYEMSIVQPGHAVGAVGAQSIGEPGTQMTLKTFHFAGVAGMSITQGVPRIKEIINASKAISTPIITCYLSNANSEHAARIAKSRIEKTFLRDIVAYLEEIWYDDGGYIRMRIDFDTVEKLQLDIGMADIEKAIRRTKGLKLGDSQIRTSGTHIRVQIPEEGGMTGKRSRTGGRRQEQEYYFRMQQFKRALPNVVIKGYPEASRAIIKKEEKKDDASGRAEGPTYALLVEGYGLKSCMTTEGLEGTRCETNSVMEMREVLGIEAARTTIIKEISSVMGDMNIDPRHMQLLADVMTYKGDVLGITRFGMAKMRDSVLQLASFEKTPDHLFDAAFHMKRDRIEGVSECIIMGQSVNLGTGASKVVRRLGISPGEVGRKKTVFEDLFKERPSAVQAAA